MFTYKNAVEIDFHILEQKTKFKTLGHDLAKLATAVATFRHKQKKKDWNIDRIYKNYGMTTKSTMNDEKRTKRRKMVWENDD